MMNTKEKVRLVFFAIIHIFLCIFVFIIAESSIQINETAGYVDEMYIDGTDFTDIANFSIWTFNGVVSIFEMIASTIALIFVSMVLVIPLRLIALRKCTGISASEFKATLWIMAAGAGVVLLVSIISLGIGGARIAAVLLLVPLIAEMVFYLSGLNSRYKASKSVSNSRNNREDKQMSDEEKKFYEDFEERETELIVLVKEECRGAGCRGDYLTPSVYFISSIDPETNEYKKEQGLLCWITHKKKNGWGYDFKKMTIYKVRVRKCFEKEGVAQVFNNRYLVVKVISKISSEPRLDADRQEYLKPVSMEDEKLGQFMLNREFGWFEGTVDWLEEEADVLLNADTDNGCTAVSAFGILKAMASDIPGWDKKVREYAAKELTELANDWNEDNDEAYTVITEENFAGRIKLGSINISKNGECEFTFDDDDMFFGHWVVVYVGKDGTPERAEIEG